MNNDQKRDEGYVEKLIQVNRVAKTVKGGRIFTFTALTVVGDGKGRVGFGRGSAQVLGLAIGEVGADAGEGVRVHHIQRRHSTAKVLGHLCGPGHCQHGSGRTVHRNQNVLEHGFFSFKG